MQSNRSIHTIEKTTSDFFNLTHESQLEQATSSHNNFMFGVPSIVSGSRAETRELKNEGNEEHQKFKKLAAEILEEVYINEVMAALDHCFGAVQTVSTLNNHGEGVFTEILRGVGESSSTNNQYLYERLENYLLQG